MPFPVLPSNPGEDCAESGCDFPLAFPVLAPGSNAYTETDANITVFHCMHGPSNELIAERDH